MYGIVIGSKEVDEMAEECNILDQYLFKATVSDYEDILKMFKLFVAEVRDVLGVHR